MIAWTIAGSDSGGGAGIQADLKAMHGLGAHGCSALVALTAQNTLGVTAAMPIPEAFIDAQIDALLTDLPPKAVKTGMLASVDVIRQVARRLRDIDAFYVCDPVMVATSGARLLDADAEQTLIKDLLPRVDLLTPNLMEAEVLAAMKIQSDQDVITAAERLLAHGPRSVLIKGGHGDGGFAQDYWSDGNRAFWLTGPRVDNPNTHGTGCTLSAAIAALTALGYDLDDALVLGKAYITEGIAGGLPVGGGSGPVHQGGFPTRAAYFPWISETAEAGRRRPNFPALNTAIGLYPLVDRAEKLIPLIEAGVTTAQLRIKDLTGEAHAQQQAEAVRLTRGTGLRLFLNDDAEAAVRLGAFGVHLGQEDMQGVDPHRLAEAGLHLGLSTHTYAELARAKAWNPSYIAYGPVYASQSKELRYQPRGPERLKRFAALVDKPLVAIGGIKLDNLDSIKDLADGIAVIGALQGVQHLGHEVQRWRTLFPWD